MLRVNVPMTDVVHIEKFVLLFRFCLQRVTSAVYLIMAMFTQGKKGRDHKVVARMCWKSLKIWCTTFALFACSAASICFIKGAF